jgi:hypothetical protein
MKCVLHNESTAAVVAVTLPLVYIMCLIYELITAYFSAFGGAATESLPKGN